MNPVGAFGGLDDTIFDGSDIYKGVMVDIVDLHFVEDVDGVLVGSVFCGLEDDGEPGRVGVSFFVEEDVTDRFESGGLKFGRVVFFVVIDVVVFGRHHGDDGGIFDLAAVVGVFGQDQLHRGWLAHRGGEDKESDEKEAEIHHGCEVYAGRQLLAFLYAGAFLMAAAGGGVELCHSIVFSMRCMARGFP